jgi:hypothetical protein
LDLALCYFYSQGCKGTTCDTDFLWAARHPFAFADLYASRPVSDPNSASATELAAGVSWMLVCWAPAFDCLAADAAA